MSNQSNTSNDKPRSVQDIIRAIEEKSADGTYILRGEPECYENISSNLYRELENVKARYSNIKEIQDNIVAEAKEYTDKTEYFDILTEIQHYGGKTNLIDFTTDYTVALFFACYGSPAECGRVIILQETDELEKIRHKPQTPEVRVRAQKSVFVEPPKGYIELEYKAICIPSDVKLLILQYLREVLGDEVSAKTIYNDIHGFIRSQSDNGIAYREYYKGLRLQREAAKAKTSKEAREACKEAISHYTNVLRLNLELSPVYNNRGVAYNHLGEHNAAIEDFKIAIQLYPAFVEAYSNRGAAYSSIGKLNHAIEDYNKALELNPSSADTYNNRGTAYNDRNEHDSAIADFNTSIKLNPNCAKAYNNRGVAKAKKNQYNAAISDFSWAIRLKSDYANAYYNRGNAYSAKGELDRAIEDYNTAIELEHDYGEAHFRRGVAYDDNGASDRAIQDYTKAIQLNPEDEEAYFRRGMVHAREYHFDLAITNFSSGDTTKVRLY